MKSEQNKQKLKLELGKLQRQSLIVDNIYRHFIGLLFLYVAFSLFFPIFAVLIIHKITSLSSGIMALVLLVIYYFVILLYYHLLLKNNSIRLRKESRLLLDKTRFVINFIDWEAYRKRIVNEENSFLNVQTIVWKAVELIKRPFNPLFDSKKYKFLVKYSSILNTMGFVYGIFSVSKEILSI